MSIISLFPPQVMARLPPALISDLPWRQLADLHLETEAELSALLKHNLFAGRGHWVGVLPSRDRGRKHKGGGEHWMWVG